jgi:hypothetical protein
MAQHAEGHSPDSVDDEVDERVVSVLLETTGESNESQSVVTKKVGPGNLSTQNLEQKSHSDSRSV